MSRIVIHNQAIYDGLTKDLADEKVEYIDNTLHYKAVALHEDYTDGELKAISKFFNDWFKDTYIYGSDAIEVVGGVVGEEKNNESCPNRCIDCKHYDAHWLYTDDMRSTNPLSLGSCEKCRRNFVSIDPHNQVPSWCPMKGE